jgi:hypothetical protein
MPVTGLGSSPSRVSGGEGSSPGRVRGGENSAPVNPPTVTPPRVSGGEYVATTTRTPTRRPSTGSFNPWLAWATWPLNVMRSWADLFWMPQPSSRGSGSSNTPTRVRGGE